jgi:hypothetical protein
MANADKTSRPNGFRSSAAEGAVVFSVTEVEVATPFGVKLAGLKVQLDSAGNPEQLKLITEPNTPEGVMLMVAEPELPTLTVTVDVVVESAKSAALTVCDTVLLVVEVKF